MPKSVIKKGVSKQKFRKPARSQKLRAGMAALLFLLGLVVLGKLVGLLVDWGNPYSPDATLKTKKTHWQEDQTLNVVFQSKDWALISFNPHKKTVTVFKIPPEVYLNLPFSLGNWPMRSVYGLGQAENPPRGAQLLVDTLSTTLGLPINGYFLWKEQTQMEAEELVEKMRTNTWSALLVLRDSKTNLSMWEMVNLLKSISSVRLDKVEILDLQQSQVTDWMLLADGSRGLYFKPALLDQFIQNKIEDSNLKDEGLTISIYNTTDHPQLAEKAARLITNLGGRVVFVGSSKDKLSQTVVLGKSSYTKKYLAGFLAPHCLERKSFISLGKSNNSCSFQGSNTDLSQADINIILGEDYFIRYNSK